MSEERMKRMKPVLDRIPREWGKYLPEQGWDDLLLDLDSRLAEIDPGYTILQAKEKFGTLRFYVSASDGAAPGTTDKLRDLIVYFEDKSAHICESCGAGGAKARHTGWIKTLCDDCAEREGKA
jgi:hypothetical protein